MENKYTYIENLLERFFEGDTSHKEEQELYKFFKGNDIPEHLLQYKNMFEYFEQGIEQETKETESKIVAIKVVKRRRFLFPTIAASVAVIALLITITFKNDSTFDPYSGSYMIKNGERIYDTKQIIAEARNIEQRIEEKEKKLERLTTHSPDITDKYYNIEYKH